MKLYHPNQVTDDLLSRLDLPTGDADGLTATFDLPVQIKGLVATHVAEMVVLGEMTCPLDEDDGTKVDLIGFQGPMLYRPALDDLARIHARGSLTMPDMSIPTFHAERLAAIARVRATFLGVDPATDESVAVAVMASPYLVGVPDLAEQVPPGLAGPDTWYRALDDFDLEDERFAPDRFAPAAGDEGELAPDAESAQLLDGPPADAGQVEAVRQAVLRAQRTGQIGDQFEDDTPLADDWAADWPIPMVPLRPMRAPIIEPGASSDQAPAPVK
ncbi:MAG: hypothetical protein LBG60_04370 [Bifidobacteriaceae bacterium]|jgi:hypothetical protein|nr:hypothetical protein [Bifidobacteriaceae bacterium]